LVFEGRVLGEGDGCLLYHLNQFSMSLVPLEYLTG
jgi:hypothetical protein